MSATQAPTEREPAPASSERRRPSTLAGAAALAILAAVAALLAARVAGPGGPWLWYYDMPKVFWPNAVFWHDAAASGGIPMWIDRLGLGYPIYAEGQIASFYLPNWLVFHLEPLLALDVTRVLHLALAGLGAGLIALRLTGTWSGAALATFVAVLSGGIVAKLEWTSVLAAYAWVPWVLLPLMRRPRPTRLGLVAAGTAWGIQALAGHPNTWVLTGICAAAVLLAARPGLPAVGRIAAFGAIGVGVGAVQLLPTAVILGLSVRSEGLPLADLFSNSATAFDPLLAGFANAFVPGSPAGWDLGRIWYPGGVYGIHEANAYVGLPVVALAAVGALARRSRPLVAAMGVLVAFAVVGAFQPSWWASVPVLNGLRHPVRAYMLVALLAGPVAAVGLARLRRVRRPWLPAAVAVGVLVAAYAGVTALAVLAPTAFERLAIATLGATEATAPGIRENAAIALTKPLPALLEVAAGAAAIGLVVLAARGRVAGSKRLRTAARLAAPALVLLALAPLAALSPMANPVLPRDDFDFRNRALMAAVLEAEPARFLADADPIFHDAMPNQPAAHGIDDLGMWSSLSLAGSEAAWRAAREGSGVDATVAGALGVDVVATFHGEPCPGTTLAQVEPNDATLCRLVVTADPPTWIPAAALPGVDPPAPAAGGPLDRLVATLRPPPVDVEVEAEALVTGEPVDVLERDDGSLRLAVSADQAGWVWIDRAWWPGWETTVDGAPVTALRALGGQLVAVAAGPHEIRQRLVPIEVPFGLLVALLTLVVAGAWAWRGRRVASPRPADGLAGAREPAPAPTPQPAPEPEPAPPEHAHRSLVRERPLELAALGAIAFLIAWFAPPVAVAVAWPFLFVVPGTLLVSRVVPRLGPAGRLGVGIVASTYAAAHLANVVGLAAGGFDRPVAMATAAILALVSLLLAGARLPWLAGPPGLDPRGALEAARREPLPFLLAAFAIIGVGSVLGGNAWREIPSGWVSGGWNWSDFLVHVSIGQSIVDGNFPPQVPYFAGVPLTYHWFADFHGAIAASTVGSHVIPVFVVSSAVMAGALALVAWELARHLTGSRRAATIATILVLLGGGMGWLRLVIDVNAGAGTAWDLIRSTPYDNTWEPGWPYFRIASILGTGLFPHRATTFGLPGLLAVVLLVRVSLGRRPAGIALAGVLAALLAPFHFYFFPASYLLVGLSAVSRRAWRRRGWLRDAALFLAPVVLAVPFVLGPALLQREQGSIRLVQGWEEAPIADGLGAVLFFYLTNLGLPLLLGAAALLVSRPPARTFLAAWAVAFFLVPNLVVAGAVEFDMNKYFQVMAVALALLGGWALRRQATLVVALVVAAAAISPALIATWHLLSEPVTLSPAQERAARWIQANTPQRSVFVTDAFINSPVDYAGRLRITTFGPYAANLGYDPEPRAADVTAAYCDGPETAREVMVRYGATYVLSSGGIPDCGDDEQTDFTSSPLFETVYDVDGVKVWRLRG